MARRKFDKQFKNSALKLILEEGDSVKEVSQELDIHANSLYRWVKQEKREVLSEKITSVFHEHKGKIWCS